MNRQSKHTPMRLLPMPAILLAFAVAFPAGAVATQQQGMAVAIPAASSGEQAPPLVGKTPAPRSLDGTGTATGSTSSELAGMKTEIDALKQGQAAMQKDLAEIKRMLQRMPLRAQPRPFKPLDIDIAGVTSRGAKDAPVTMIEYSDYQCPFCGRYVRNTLPMLLKDYVDTGKVRYLIHEMPLTNIHPYAQKAAEAALCAGRQGKYWAMYGALFKNQAHLKPDDLTRYAKASGLDLPEFSHCLESDMQAKEVQGKVKSGMQVGVHGTPTFFLGRTNPQTPDKLHATQMIQGAQPFIAFKQAIDTLLEPPRKPRS